MVTTTTLEPPVAAEVTEAAIRSALDHMLLVNMVVRSPNYRVVMTRGEVRARTEGGAQRTVGARHATRSRWKWNQHPLFEALAANSNQAAGVLAFHSAPGPDGLRMMPEESFGAFQRDLDEVRARRDEQVQRVQQSWHGEILPALAAFHGDVFYQIAPLLPAAQSLPERYRILTTFIRLSATDPGNLRLEQLTADQQHQAIQRQREAIDRMYRERFACLFDNVFGQVVATCQDLLEGPLDPQTGRRDRGRNIQSGTRKAGALEKILSTLDRLSHFHQFTSPAVMAKVHAARTLVGRHTVDQLNAGGGDNPVSAAVAVAIGELNDAVQRSWQSSSRALRSIEF